MPVCRICGNERGNHTFVAREMMLGLRDQFDYFHCAECGCLQIAELPADMSRYYPPNYYSYGVGWVPPASSALRRWLKARRLDQWLGNRTIIGSLCYQAFGPPAVQDSVLDELRSTIRLRADSAVLDVGCGSGMRLLHWSQCGFTDLRGFDPYVADDIRYADAVSVTKT